MNSKKRYIPIIALGALILSLFAILPVAAAGEVEFVVPGDVSDENDGSLTDESPDAQTWTNQGGQVGILIDDSDTDSVVKRVLLPHLDTVPVTSTGGATVTANSNVITLNAPVADIGGTDGLQTVERDDLVMVGYETLRKVTKVSVEDVDGDSAGGQPTDIDDDIVTITLDRPFPKFAAGTSRQVHIVKRLYVDSDESEYNAFDGDGYKSLASGLRFRGSEITRVVRQGETQITFGGGKRLLNSGIGTHDDADYADGTPGSEGPPPGDHGLSYRLMSNLRGGSIGTEDVLGIELTNLRTDEETPLGLVSGTVGVGPETYPAVDLGTGNRSFRTTGDRTTTAHDNAFALFWSAEENDTGSDVTVRSQAYQTATTLSLRETGPTSGRFAAKIQLIPSEVEVPWDNLQDADGDNFEHADGGNVRSGQTVTLDDTPVSDYNGYKVEFPSQTRVVDNPDTADVDESENAMVKVKTVADFAQDIPRLPVNPRDVISVRHPDDSGTLRVETTGSLFSAFSPAHNSAARDDRPELSVQVVDNDSGLKESDIDIIYTVNDTVVRELEPDRNGYTDPIAGGFSVRARVNGEHVPDEGNNVIKWWVKAKDRAGNYTYSDRQPTVDGDADRCNVTTDDDDAVVEVSTSLCQPYIIMVDNVDPSMLRAETGRHWDTSLSTGDSDDKTEYRVKEASTTSIMVVFDEHLDAATVQANDFEVNDANPSSADVFNVTVRDDTFRTYAETGETPAPGDSPTDDDPNDGDGNKAIAGDDVQDVGEKRGYVFLTVNALTPNARPKVELVDNVEDIAGNRKSTGTIQTATDRIAPTLTVAVREGDRPVTNKDVTLTVTSNEDIGTPTVRYMRVDSHSPDDGDSDQTLATARTDAVVTFKSAKEYEVKITPNEDGLYTVFVTADDSAGGNPGTIGDETDPIDVDSDTTAILFERDKNLSKPDFDPDKSGVNDSFETDDANGFIRIDYSAEGKEYTTTTRAAVAAVLDDPATTNVNEARAAVPEMSGDDLDTHGRLTVVSATFDGNDITDALNSNSAGNVFQYHLDGIAVGEYKLEMTVRDEAGNQNAAAHKGTIKVIERKPYKLTLNPGWNLVSLPGQPADTDINAVIPADHPIDAVRGYDPMVPGAWLIAEEGGDGTFSGTLETIEAGTAYWIKSTSFQDLEVNIPKPTPGSLTLLPTISISQGWNLVPILDVDGDFELADQTPTDNYFSGLTTGSIAAIYTYNTVTNSWMAVEEDGVALGKGYWVYATKPGVIVP